MVREETDEKTNNLKASLVKNYPGINARRPDKVWPDMWKHMSDASKRKEKQKWAIEKPKHNNARRLRGIYFIDSEDEEFKITMINARRKLEIPM